LESFDAGLIFGNIERIRSASETCYGNASGINEPNKSKEKGMQKTILINFIDHGISIWPLMINI
jgi:predicted alternative tryptophan synthase beta-subunit